MADPKKAYEKKLEAQLAQWEAEIDKLQAQADQAEAEARREYYDRIEKIRELQESARRKLDHLKNAGDDAWQDLKSGAEMARDALASAVKSAANRFR